MEENRSVSPIALIGERFFWSVIVIPWLPLNKVSIIGGVSKTARMVMKEHFGPSVYWALCVLRRAPVVGWYPVIKRWGPAQPWGVADRWIPDWACMKCHAIMPSTKARVNHRQWGEKCTEKCQLIDPRGPKMCRIVRVYQLAVKCSACKMPMLSHPKVNGRAICWLNATRPCPQECGVWISSLFAGPHDPSYCEGPPWISCVKCHKTFTRKRRYWMGLSRRTGKLKHACVNFDKHPTVLLRQQGR